ncbi:hypothetical protein FHS96_001558 [Sphingomonas zeicaulis]
MLRLAAAAAVIHHQLLRHPSGEFGAHIFFNHRQRQIDTRSHTRRGPDRPIDDEDAILFQLDRG